MPEIHDTVIIGAGMAGLTAAIYASRKRMDYVIVASDFGGQFSVSGEILNYPGVVETTGVDFQDMMQEQMEFNDVEVMEETVEGVEHEDGVFTVKTDKNSYRTRTLIIATGSHPRKLKVPGEEEFMNKGVTYCSICDGPLFADKKVAIIGGGDAALEAVDFMKDIASEIHVFTNEKQFRAHEYLQERVDENPKVTPHFNVEVEEIVGDDFVSGIRFNEDGEEKTLKVEGVIIEIGRVPNTEPFKDLVELDDEGHIKVDCRANTSVDGVFAAGDCTDVHEYQYVIAGGQGCIALIKAARYLSKHRM